MSRKRFYKAASVGTGETGVCILLDGKAVKTPAGKPLAVPFPGLAEAIAREWNAQGTHIDPATMPMTQLASTALDRVGPEREAIILQLVRYGRTDLVCYPAQVPAELALAQKRAWQPVLDWAAEALAAPLETTHGLAAIAQPEASLNALEARIRGYDVWRLTALQAATAASGSLLLGLALVEGRLDSGAVCEASQIDETHQALRWGEDAEDMARRALLKADITAAAALLFSVTDGPGQGTLTSP